MTKPTAQEKFEAFKESIPSGEWKHMPDGSFLIKSEDNLYCWVDAGFYLHNDPEATFRAVELFK